MATAALPKAVVVLGAGASFDVANEGAPVLSPVGRPPLARDLFAGQREHVNAVLRRYPGAQILAQRLGPLIATGENSVEVELRKFAEHPDDTLRRYFNFIPPYLRDLIFIASETYVEIPSNYVQLAMRLLSDSPHQVAFVSLNYDTLLENALSRYKPKEYTFEHLSHYVHPSRQSMVFKVHGSIDWFRPLRPTLAGTWEASVESFEPHSRVSDELVSVLRPGPEVRDKQHNGNFLYPVLTAPLAGKGTGDLVCPSAHLNALKAFLRDCSKYLFVGTSGFDDDLLGFIRENAPSSIVGYHVGAEDIQDSQGRIEAAIPQLRRGVDWSRRYGNGFKNFVTTSEFDEFLALTL